jgi:hypothetical protein
MIIRILLAIEIRLQTYRSMQGQMIILQHERPEDTTMNKAWGMRPFSIGLSLKVFFLALSCFFLATSSWAQQDLSSASEKESEKQLETQQGEMPEIQPGKQLEEQPKTEGKKKEFLTRGQKTLLLNVGGMAAIFAYGLAKWDYGEESFHFQNEGWFDRDTKHGGADKLGHFWSSYAYSHAISWAYRRWGYTESEANLYAALSNLGMQTFMELADGFSGYGFSYEDMLMNILGVGAAYVWGRYPDLARKIDFRIEYKPEFNQNDFELSTNYERQKFLVAVKADGFDFIKNPYLQYLEFHVGYYARGYDDFREGGPDNRRRHIYVGLGFNVSKLLQKVVDTKILNYLQIPYTSVGKDVAAD